MTFTDDEARAIRGAAYMASHFDGPAMHARMKRDGQSEADAEIALARECVVKLREYLSAAGFEIARKELP